MIISVQLPMHVIKRKNAAKSIRKKEILVRVVRNSNPELI